MFICVFLFECSGSDGLRGALHTTDTQVDISFGVELGQVRWQVSLSRPAGRPNACRTDGENDDFKQASVESITVPECR